MKQNKLWQVILLALTLTTANFTYAQQEKSTNYINAGIGIGTFGFTGTGGLPITASFEHSFTDKISAGIGLGLVHTSLGTDWKYSYYVIGVRGSYHFNELLKVNNPNLDVYGGATLFYRGYSIKYTGSDAFYDKAYAGAISLAIHIGSHYYFSKNIGAFAEVGYGISPLQLGINFRF